MMITCVTHTHTHTQLLSEEMAGHQGTLHTLTSLTSSLSQLTPLRDKVYTCTIHLYVQYIRTSDGETPVLLKLCDKIIGEQELVLLSVTYKLLLYSIYTYVKIYACLQQVHPIILHSIECEARVPLILSCQEYVCSVKDQLVSRTGDLAEQTRDRMDILEQRLRSWQVRNVHHCNVQN